MSITKKEEELGKQKQKVEELEKKRQQELERISGLTSEQAKEYLLKTVEDEVKHDTAVMIKTLESRAKEEADKKAKEIVVNAIQRCAADHVAETTISVVQLPNDEMKGRIIGREGRNIRTLETLTGVELIIDDTPEAVVLSGFDPVRREVARIALEKLILDGRIHPARIEEMVEKAQKEVEVKEQAKEEISKTATAGFDISPYLEMADNATTAQELENIIKEKKEAEEQHMLEVAEKVDLNKSSESLTPIASTTTTTTTSGGSSSTSESSNSNSESDTNNSQSTWIIHGDGFEYKSTDGGFNFR